MAYILDAGTALRVIAAAPEDALVRWIEQDRIRPFIDAVTMSLALDTIRKSTDLSATGRTILLRRYDALSQALDAGETTSVGLAAFDLRSAEILADLLGLEDAGDSLNALDLVPAAIAIQNNYELVAADNAEDYRLLAATLPNEVGRLRLTSFDPVTG